jgi:hypothetical protein
MKKIKEKKTLEQSSKRDLIRLVKDQHKYIKTLNSNNEYLNGVLKANKFQTMAIMFINKIKKCTLTTKNYDEVINNYVLKWERNEETKDMTFEMVKREDIDSEIKQ